VLLGGELAHTTLDPALDLAQPAFAFARHAAIIGRAHCGEAREEPERRCHLDRRQDGPGGRGQACRGQSARKLHQDGDEQHGEEHGAGEPDLVVGVCIRARASPRVVDERLCGGRRAREPRGGHGRRRGNRIRSRDAA
jgi:hypothetical protein